MLDRGASAHGYLSILPVDQASSTLPARRLLPTPIYFDSGKIVELAIRSRCNRRRIDLRRFGLWLESTPPHPFSYAS